MDAYERNAITRMPQLLTCEKEQQQQQLTRFNLRCFVVLLSFLS